MKAVKWRDDGVETTAGGVYRFGSVGEQELESIKNELRARGEVWAILKKAQYAFAEGKADYEGAAARLLDLVREAAKVDELLEEVFGWIDLCFDGRTPLADLPKGKRMEFAIEAVEALEGWRNRPRGESAAPKVEAAEAVQA